MAERERMKALQEQVEEITRRIRSGEELDNPATSPLAPKVMRIAAEVLEIKTELVCQQVEEDPRAAGQIALLTWAVAEHAKDFCGLAQALAVAQAIHAAECN